MATEVIRGGHYVERPRRIVGVLERVLDLAFGLLYTLFLVRLVLVFFGARQGTGFYELIHDATQPFYRPFEGIFATTTFNGWHLEWPILVAMLAYALLHGIIRAVLSLLTR